MIRQLNLCLNGTLHNWIDPIAMGSHCTDRPIVSFSERGRAHEFRRGKIGVLDRRKSTSHVHHVMDTARFQHGGGDHAAISTGAMDVVRLILTEFSQVVVEELK